MDGPSLESQFASVFPRKLVTALEILRFYADAFANAGFNLALEIRKFHKDPSARYDPMVMKLCRVQLGKLSTDCAELPVTSVKIKRILEVLDSPEMMATLPPESIPKMLEDIQVGIEDELSTKLFFQLRPDRAKMFDHPTDGWAKVLDRFREARVDVEEMHKCFALSRYAGAVFHSVQVIEFGLLDLGVFLELDDPKSGWTAVTNRLGKLIKTNFHDLNEKYQKHFPFLEQMQGTAEALKNAWRNKISHAQGKLVLLNSEFTPDIAEEIIMATRAFMRRLATELPK
jgi:hypothetical protein